MKNFKISKVFLNHIKTIFLLFLLSSCSNFQQENEKKSENILDYKDIEQLVYAHAKAWKNGDSQLLSNLLHEDIIFAYPGRRLNKSQTIEDLISFNKSFKDTEVYINEIIIDGNNVVVEWQFATTNIKTGKRQVVSDAIISEIKDGKFVLWKEYLDGRVKNLQASGELELEEGQEPFPWPKSVKKE